MAIAYFADREDLLSLMGDWPAEVRLILMLRASGETDVMFRHVEDASPLLARIAARLDCNEAEIEIAAADDIADMLGLTQPRLKLTFSQERRFLGLLRGRSDILDAASDYEMNFRFARDTGVDPDAIMGPDFDLAGADAEPEIEDAVVVPDSATDPDAPVAPQITPRKTALSVRRRGSYIVIGGPRSATEGREVLRFTVGPDLESILVPADFGDPGAGPIVFSIAALPEPLVQAWRKAGRLDLAVSDAGLHLRPALPMLPSWVVASATAGLILIVMTLITLAAGGTMPA